MQWLRRFLPKTAPPPPTPIERASLEYERRKLEREIRESRKVLKHGGDCRTCTSPHPGRLRVAKRLRAAESRLSEIEARLSSA